MPSAFPNKSWRIAAVVLLVAGVAWFALGWHRVPEERWTVHVGLSGAVSGPLQPGWAWSLWPFQRVVSLPRGPRQHEFTVGAGADRLTSDSGAALAVSGSLRYRIDESGLDLASRRLHHEEQIVRWLDACLRDSIRQLLSTGRIPEPTTTGSALIADELSERLSAGGISLLELRVDGIGGPREIGASQSFGALPDARLLIIGWDGADWNLLDPLLAAGDLPHLARLIEHGSRARLKTVTPVLSPVVWTSVATGTRPAKHGIVDFLAVDRATGEKVPVTSNLRRVPALWTTLSRWNTSVGVVAWWATWPAEPVNGYMVTDRIAYQLFGMGEQAADVPEGKTWPPELLDEIQDLIVRPESITDADVRRLADLPDDPAVLDAADRSRLEDFKTVLAATETYDAIALQLASRRDTVVRCVYYEATDTAAHLFMPFAPPRRPDVDESSFNIWSGVVNAVYRDMDRRLGRLLATVDENTAVILLSDHGFRTGDHRPVGDARIGGGRAGDWHRKYGVLVLSGPGVRRDASITEASVIDVAPTALAILGLPVPPEMDGRVLEEALEEDLLRARPVRYLGAPAAAQATGEPIPSAADAAIVERLRSLGYLGSTDDDDTGPLAQDEVTAFNNRATILLAGGQVQEAVDELRQGLVRAPGAVPLRVNLARALRAQGDDSEARRILEAVLVDRPASAEVENLLGNIDMDQGDLVAAELRFLRGLEIDPNFTGAHISLGLLRERQNRPDEAIDLYRRAGQIDPDAAEPFNNIGNLHRARALAARGRADQKTAATQFATAVESYQRALEADPDFIGSYNNLALVYQETGRVDKAMELYRRALERQPDNAVVHNNLGSLYFAANRLDDARKAFEEAIALDAEYESAYNNLGAVLGRLGSTLR